MRRRFDALSAHDPFLLPWIGPDQRSPAAVRHETCVFSVVKPSCRSASDEDIEFVHGTENRRAIYAIYERGENDMVGARSVADLMTKEVVTLVANDTLNVADDVMGLARIRHMPVVDEDGLVVGLISQRDLFRGALARALGYGEFAQQKLLGILHVEDVMSSDVLTISPTATLIDAAKTMTDRKIGCLVVVEEERLAGILTEGDFVRLVLSEDQ